MVIYMIKYHFKNKIWLQTAIFNRKLRCMHQDLHLASLRSYHVALHDKGFQVTPQDTITQRVGGLMKTVLILSTHKS